MSMRSSKIYPRVQILILIQLLHTKCHIISIILTAENHT